MKFSEKYPATRYGDEPQSCIVKLVKPGEKPASCWHCNEPTEWYDLTFEAPLCSDECANAKWDEYNEACRQSEEKYGKSILEP